jgi:endonuclease/exonuclease/phosphatase (EEP) superfamily protein YafD
MTALALLFYLLGAVIVAVTILPIWQTTHWWVRLCDFPRYQVSVLALIVLILMPLTFGPLTAAELSLFIAVALAALWQVSWIWRYLPGAPLEVPSSAAVPNGTGRIALLTTNVFQDCRDAGALLQIISDADPDLILAVETDEWWCSRLSEALRTRYQYGLAYPLSNGYGMSMFSRLELLRPTIRFLVDDAIPSIKTGVRLRSGAVIDLYGMHPQPPAPLQDSTERDVELVLVGVEIKSTGRPSVVLGDLNDVAWSPTTAEFARAGDLRDPRRGRGFFNTYPARLPGLRYPLDYVFHTKHFSVGSMRVLPKTGSDHLPLIAVLDLHPNGTAPQVQPS